MNNTDSGRIIFLNGASSSGKSSIARMLQLRLDEPFLHFEIDKFAEMMPESTDELWLKMADGFNQSIAAMADAGNSLIVDHVLLIKKWAEDCVCLLHDRPSLFVGLHCSIEELERREKNRPVRNEGLARSQHLNIHKRKIYDLKLQTDKLTVEECCDLIVTRFNQGQFKAFAKLHKSYLANERSLPALPSEER